MENQILYWPWFRLPTAVFHYEEVWKLGSVDLQLLFSDNFDRFTSSRLCGFLCSKRPHLR